MLGLGHYGADPKEKVAVVRGGFKKRDKRLQAGGSHPLPAALSHQLANPRPRGTSPEEVARVCEKLLMTSVFAKELTQGSKGRVLSVPVRSRHSFPVCPSLLHTNTCEFKVPRPRPSPTNTLPTATVRSNQLIPKCSFSFLPPARLQFLPSSLDRCSPTAPWLPTFGVGN
ncbi:hypothetical protein H1C71_003070 [Ictidomys tridecemlineatus]|nr:hypothetical protein H1C71_003070 [Ictidomys tridecemlineatus]